MTRFLSKAGRAASLSPGTAKMAILLTGLRARIAPRLGGHCFVNALTAKKKPKPR